MKCITLIDDNYEYNNTIEIDVNRSLLNIVFKSLSENEMYNSSKEYRKSMKLSVSNLIKKIFTLRNPNEYSYYQGYHEYGLYMYLLFLHSEEMSLSILQKLTEFFFYDCIHITKHSKTQMQVFQDILESLLELIDPEIALRIQAYEIPPSFGFAWIISWFTHANEDVVLQYRIFDYLLCSHPMCIFYLTATVKLSNLN